MQGGHAFVERYTGRDGVFLRYRQIKVAPHLVMGDLTRECMSLGRYSKRSLDRTLSDSEKSHCIILRHNLVHNVYNSEALQQLTSPAAFVLPQWGRMVGITKVRLPDHQEKPKLLVRPIPSSNNGNFRVRFVRSLEQR